MPTDEEGATSASSPKARPATATCSIRPDGKSIAFVSDQSGREEIHVIAADGAGPARKLTDLDDSEVGHRLVARQQDDRLHDLRSQALHDRRRRQGPQGAGVLDLRPDRPPGVVAGRQADRLLQDRRHPLDRRLPDPQRRRRGEEDHVRLGRRGQPPVLGRRDEGLLRAPRGGSRRRGAPNVAALLRPAREADAATRTSRSSGRTASAEGGPGGASRRDGGRGPSRPRPRRSTGPA